MPFLLTYADCFLTLLMASDAIIDGESLGDILIEAGMAVRYDGGKKTHKWCDPINE